MSNNVDGQLFIPIFSPILTFDFDLILESFLAFLGPDKLFLESGYGSKTVLGLTHVVEQLLFSMLNSDI